MLTAVVLTLDEAENITDCLQSLLWADRIVVFDSFSSDQTVPLAVKMGAEVRQSEFRDYASQRNLAVRDLQTEWVLFVDADERATTELATEVREATQQPQNAWNIPRHNYIFGRLTLGAGWYPDYQLRLFRQGTVTFQRPVHEIAVVEGDTGTLKSPLIHHNYRDPEHFHMKQRVYLDYDARKLLDEGVRPRLYSPFSQAIRHLWWRFVTLRGYRDGPHGLRLSLYLSYYEALKYRTLARLWREGADSETGPDWQ